MYLIKAFRFFGNHQYIIGVCEDKELAHLYGYHHCSLHRANKYYYTLEKSVDGPFIRSYENDDETLSYSFQYDDEDKDVDKYKDKYRYEYYEIEPIDYKYFGEGDLAHIVSMAYNIPSQCLKGMKKEIERVREQGSEAFIRDVLGGKW
jgi:hypothetical protein